MTYFQYNSLYLIKISIHLKKLCIITWLSNRIEKYHISYIWDICDYKHVAEIFWTKSYSIFLWNYYYLNLLFISYAPRYKGDERYQASCRIPSNVINNTNPVRLTDMATAADPSVNQLLYWDLFVLSKVYRWLIVI